MRTLFAFLGGAVAGAAIALLLAPEKGEVTRRKIKGMVDHGIEEAEERIRSVRGKVSRGVDKAEEKAQEVRRKANRATREKIDELAEAIKEL